MSVSTPPSDVDLGSLEFWGQPADERDRYFEHLRRSAPISRHEPPEDILGLPDQGRMHYWAIVRYDDIRRISRDHSGNRDERVFERPWELDVTRNPNRHLGFGGGGPHYCMGASLARTQLNAIFGEMLRVIPDIEAGEPELLRSAFIHGIKRMPCTFTARA